jgi:hypothetical protein
LDVYLRFADHPNDGLLGVDEQECLLSWTATPRGHCIEPFLVSATHRADYVNKVGYVAIFLKAFGVNKLLKNQSARSTARRWSEPTQTKNWNASTAVRMHDSFSKYFATITSGAIN